MKYQSLQFLRGISAFLVLFLHLLQQSNIKPFGYGLPAQAAVDVFFLLSGFIILSSLREAETSKTFIIKRVFRIFPVYWLILAVFIAFYTLFQNEFIPHNKIILNTFLLPYGYGIYKSSIVGVAWSTMFEMYFYTVITILLSIKISKKHIPIFVATLIIFLYIVSRIIDNLNLNININSYMLSIKMILGSPHVLMFVAGTLIFYFFTLIEKMLKNINVKIFLVISTVLYGFLFLIPYNMILALIIVPATFCLWIISEKKNVVNFERNPLLKLFVKIGDWSYSLFLIHMVFIYIFKNIFSDSFLFLALFSIICSVISSYILYTYIEKPFIRFGKQLIVYNSSHLPIIKD